MEKKRKHKRVMATLAFAAVLAVSTLMVAGYYGSGATQSELKAEDPSEVCMVTDRVFGKPQIPVEFGGKTYYGCCAGCVNRIKNDRSVRYSTDPVSGVEVDKAEAVIIRSHLGEALYFESVDTAGKYLAKREDRNF